MMADYVMQIKVRNGPLLRAMRASGYETAAEFSRASGVDQRSIGDYLNLKTAPMRKNGKWSAPVIRMSECLRCLPEDLFPPQHINAPLAKNSAEIEASIEDVAAYLEAPRMPDQLLIQSESLGKMWAAIDSLSERDRRVLIARWGLDGGDPETLDVVAERQGVTRERIRQIESRAIRTLRHPRYATALKDALEDLTS